MRKKRIEEAMTAKKELAAKLEKQLGLERIGASILDAEKDGVDEKGWK